MALGNDIFYFCLGIPGAFMMLLVLLTSLVRQSWNLGVFFLCFWILVEIVLGAVGYFNWSDNGDLKLYTFCDIASHAELICAIVKPMATLLISRRLYLIASLRSVELPTTRAKRWDIAIEWTLGLLIPVLVAGPLNYVVQDHRFVVWEGIGCTDSQSRSGLTILLVESWKVTPPLLSVMFYFPKIVRTFCTHKRELDHFLRSGDAAVSHTNYLRILTLASIDLIFILPFGIVTIMLQIFESDEPLPFYAGRGNQAPVTITEADLRAIGTSALVLKYWRLASTPALSIMIFILFGVTSEARTSYRRALCIVSGWVGLKVALEVRQTNPPVLDALEFGAPPWDTETGEENPGTRQISPGSFSAGSDHLERGIRRDVVIESDAQRV